MNEPWLTSQTGVQSSTTTRVSVVIPSRNRPKELRRCLASTAALTHPYREVVVVDQSDDHDGAGDSIPNGVDIYLKPETVGKCVALNEGIRSSTGDVFAFTDDDCSVEPDWLSRGLSWFESNPTLGIVCGPARAAEHDPRSVFVPEFAPRQTALRRGRSATRHIGALGGNMLVRRSVFETVGLFDELLGPGALYPSGEDQDLNNRALRAGFAVLYDPAVSVTHWGGRRYADGSAARLLRDYSVGIGALVAKSVRSGDFAAGYALPREIGAEVLSLGRHCLPGHAREPFVLRSPWLVAGFARGLFQPLDRSRGVFVGRR